MSIAYLWMICKKRTARDLRDFQLVHHSKSNQSFNLVYSSVVLCIVEFIKQKRGFFLVVNFFMSSYTEYDTFKIRILHFFKRYQFEEQII